MNTIDERIGVRTLNHNQSEHVALTARKRKGERLMKNALTFGMILMFAVALVAPAYAADLLVTATGKVEVKDKVVSIKVAEAKGADGKAVADLKDKVLKVTGAKVADVEKLAGKEVDVKGVVKGADIDVLTVAEKKAEEKKPAEKK